MGSNAWSSSAISLVKGSTSRLAVAVAASSAYVLRRGNIGPNLLPEGDLQSLKVWVALELLQVFDSWIPSEMVVGTYQFEVCKMAVHHSCEELIVSSSMWSLS